jgi:hypothetical protein
LWAITAAFDHGFHGASVTRSYYAAYQGIWVAVGDPRWAAGDITV